MTRLGIAAELSRLRLPEMRFAVVYDTDRWRPVQPPAGFQWDYEPHPSLEDAIEALAHWPEHEDPCLWALRDGTWGELEPGEQP